MANKPVYIDYIRSVDTPFLDYYTNDSTFEITYMAASTTVAVPAGSTSRSGLSGAVNVTSLTTNFEWDDGDIPQIVNIFIGLLGIQLESADLSQISGTYEQIIDKE
jgi:hypothetical protein